MEEAHLARWKLFDKFKSKKEEDNKKTEIPIQESEEISQPEPETIDEKKEESPITDYHETLYSNGQGPKKSTESPKTSEKPWKPKSWESPHTIEKNVDGISKKKIGHTEKFSESSDINKKVDRVLSKKKQ